MDIHCETQLNANPESLSSMWARLCQFTKSMLSLSRHAPTVELRIHHFIPKNIIAITTQRRSPSYGSGGIRQLLRSTWAQPDPAKPFFIWLRTRHPPSYGSGGIRQLLRSTWAQPNPEKPSFIWLRTRHPPSYGSGGIRQLLRSTWAQPDPAKPSFTQLRARLIQSTNTILLLSRHVPTVEFIIPSEHVELCEWRPQNHFKQSKLRIISSPTNENTIENPAYPHAHL